MMSVSFNYNTTAVTREAETAYPSRAPELIPLFSRIRVAQSLVLYVVFCLFFRLLPLYCLSFEDLRSLITSVGIFICF